MFNHSEVVIPALRKMWNGWIRDALLFAIIIVVLIGFFWGLVQGISMMQQNESVRNSLRMDRITLYDSATGHVIQTYINIPDQRVIQGTNNRLYFYTSDGRSVSWNGLYLIEEEQR
jgi:hypothetical protein